MTATVQYVMVPALFTLSPRTILDALMMNVLTAMNYQNQSKSY